MKEGIIKITGSDNLYYDSTTKQYKSKMHCPHCGKYSGCWCYPDFESTPTFDEEYPNVYCSDRHFVLGEKNNIRCYAKEMGIRIKLTMEEWNASKIVRAVMEDVDTDFDISGNSCES